MAAAISFFRAAIVAALFGLAGCVSLVGTADPAADQILSRFSQDTAKFLAAAAAGKAEQSLKSKEAIAYYAGAYDSLDQLATRAAQRRGRVRCTANADLPTLYNLPEATSPLPQSYTAFDCRETELYVLRFTLDQLRFHHADGKLSETDVSIYGKQLRDEIFVAIQNSDTLKM